MNIKYLGTAAAEGIPAIFCNCNTCVEAMKRLKQKSQNVIILKYWYEMTDDEIGKILNLKRTTVNYNKNAALRKLKIIIEEMIENDEWFEF